MRLAVCRLRKNKNRRLAAMNSRYNNLKEYKRKYNTQNNFSKKINLK